MERLCFSILFLRKAAKSMNLILKTAAGFRSKILFPVLMMAAFCGAGCRTYNYRIVQPAATSQIIAEQSVTVHYDPLDYRFVRHHDRLVMRISNPTDDQIGLQQDRSFVVDPEGESHPLRAQVIYPHSSTHLLLPPRPVQHRSYASSPWGWGSDWPPAPFVPDWDPFYDEYYFWPYISVHRVHTIYDWTWEKGSVRLRLSYECKGQTFEHNFQIMREQVK
jgi:hypothetical protein